MLDTNKITEGLKKVEEKTEELIYEFHAHYQSYIEEHPDDKDRKDEIFQAWVIQKIAGLQLSVLELAEKFNNSLRINE
jgi:hypothetical protein